MGGWNDEKERKARYAAEHRRQTLLHDTLLFSLFGKPAPEQTTVMDAVLRLDRTITEQQQRHLQHNLMKDEVVELNALGMQRLAKGE
jgi:hypothetical protein